MYEKMYEDMTITKYKVTVQMSFYSDTKGEAETILTQIRETTEDSAEIITDESFINEINEVKND
jgi:hypothetical protein